jgi:dihydropteroate synthase
VRRRARPADSFSDGGRHASTEAAVEHGLRLAEQGADLVDVGGESTRPGAERTSTEEEQRRVLPVVEALAAEGVVVSVDTMRATTAERAVGVGARLVNDVSGGLADDRMLSTVARLEVPCVLMHWRAHAVVMDSHAAYDDVVADVVRELGQRLDAARAAGIDPQRIAVDPGIGFAKTPEQSWDLLAGLPTLTGLGHPVLVGASRKRFLAELVAPGHDPAERDPATAAVTAIAAAQGAWCVRVHDVVGSLTAVRVAERWTHGGIPAWEVRR